MLQHRLTAIAGAAGLVAALILGLNGESITLWVALISAFLFLSGGLGWLGGERASTATIARQDAFVFSVLLAIAVALLVNGLALILDVYESAYGSGVGSGILSLAGSVTVAFLALRTWRSVRRSSGPEHS